MPRSRTEETGATTSVLTANGTERIWCWRRGEVHQITSVLSALSWSRLDRIHLPTSLIQSETRIWTGAGNSHLGTVTMKCWIILCTKHFKNHVDGGNTLEVCFTKFSRIEVIWWSLSQVLVTNYLCAVWDCVCVRIFACLVWVCLWVRAYLTDQLHWICL